MTATIIALALKFWPVIVAALGIAGAYFKGRSDKAKAVKAEQASEEAKARNTADQVQNDIGALPPDEARKRLGTWSRD